MIKDYQELGVVYIPSLFREHVSNLRKGVEYNMHNPGPYAAENLNQFFLGIILVYYFLYVYLGLILYF